MIKIVMKYKMIIVDDEKRVRRGLKAGIDWQELGIEVVGDAKDGVYAIPLIKKYKPELIITDVKMPRMDGLELAKKIRKIVPDTKIIILSGYQEFEYVQTAIKNHLFDYILKPIEVENIENVIKKALNSLKKERERLENEEELRNRLNETLPLLKERFLDYLLTNRITLEEIQDKHDYLQLNIKNENLLVMVAEIDEDDFTDKEQTRLKMIDIKEKIMKTVNSNFQGEVIEEYPDRFIIIVSYQAKLIKEERQKQIKQMGTQLINLLQDDYGISSTIGVGKHYQGAEFIADSYEEALEALGYNLFAGKGQVIFIEDVTVSRNKDVFVYPFELEEKIIMSLKIGATEKSVQSAFLFIEKLCGQADMSPVQVKKGCLELIYTIMKKMIQWDFDIDYIKKEELIEKKIRNTISVDILKRSIIEFVEYISDKIKDQKNRQKVSLIQKTIKYIENNYDRDISLNDIAEKVYLTPSYLANLFKEDTGETVMNYLTRIRINEAKNYLENTDKKIYQIAEEVGFNNSKYFSRVFKKRTGYTPGQYRKQQI